MLITNTCLTGGTYRGRVGRPGAAARTPAGSAARARQRLPLPDLRNPTPARVTPTRRARVRAGQVPRGGPSTAPSPLRLPAGGEDVLLEPRPLGVLGAVGLLRGRAAEGGERRHVVRRCARVTVGEVERRGEVVRVLVARCERVEVPPPLDHFEDRGVVEGLVRHVTAERER